MNLTKLTETLIAGVFFSLPALAQGQGDPAEAALMANLRQKYPKTVFKTVSKTQLPGIYEVVMGKNVAYVEETGRYFLFGHLFDMQTQTDLTAEKHGPSPDASDAAKIDYKGLPFKDAIKIVRGKGRREIAVFSDVDCPYCKQLENNLSAMDDLTIHVFLFPIDQLHSQARVKSVNVWCAKDRAKAWNALMLKGEAPEAKECDNPVERNVALAARLNINGTPTVILSDGTLVPGAVSAERLETMLKQVAAKDGGDSEGKKTKAEKK